MQNKVQVAVVTGAMGGIGAEICKSLRESGYVVIGLYNKSYNPSLSDCDQSNGENIHCDILDYELCQNTVSQIIASHGHISILVNVAGITRDCSFKKMTYEQWNGVLQVNLVGLFNITNPIFKHMSDNQYGRIVTISSVNGHKGQFGQVNYSSSKAGIFGFTKSLALEGARNSVTVNSISPGYIETPMTASMPLKALESITSDIPVGRLGKPSDVARAVNFLVDRNASYITGADININGGLVMV